MGQKGLKSHFDYILVVSVGLLLAIGVTMVYSASAIYAQENFHDAAYFLKREIVFLIIGLAALFLASATPLEMYQRYIYPIMGGALLLLALVFIPGLGAASGAAIRWIKIGSISFQPSEIAKVALVLFLAYMLAKKGEKLKRFTSGFLPIVFLSGLLIALVLAGKDLGNAVLMGGVLMLLLYIAGTRLPYLMAIILIAIPTLCLQVLSHEYRRKRILAFLNPWEYQSDAGFQIIQSYVAFNKGGLLGQGLGEGKQKLFYLPAAHTDFIFSVLGEELGWIGIIVTLAIFFTLIARAFIIGWRSQNPFHSYLALGIGSLLGLQVILNVGVVLGLLPTKGLTLPFISYGGSSLVMSLFMIGLLLNISSHTELTPQ